MSDTTQQAPAVRTYSAAEVALRYGHKKDYVLRRTRDTKKPWPHLRGGRSIRFTEAHLAEIDAMHEVRATPAPTSSVTDWGQKTRSVSL